jgi:Ca2+-binding RTX toxin-like protein
MKTYHVSILTLVIGVAALATSSESLGVDWLGRPATIVGSALSEVLYGTAGDDVIHGLGGNDEIYGGEGNDVICGGDGNDFLDGEAGNDRLNGGPGDDALADQGGGTDTADYLTSPTGVAVFLDNSLPSADGFGGQDSLDNIENVAGSPFADQLTGTSGRNVILGRGGDDFLYGLQGRDRLIGGLGNDTAYGDPARTPVPPKCNWAVLRA